MGASFIITESQMRGLLTEQIDKTVDQLVHKNHENIQSMLDKSSNLLGEHKEKLSDMIWEFCGFAGVVSDYVKEEFPDLPNSSVNLLTLGAVCKYFYPNEELQEKIETKMIEKNLTKTFEKTIKKCDKLKKTLISFLESVFERKTKGNGFKKYAFILPLLPAIHDISTKGNKEHVKILINKLYEVDHFSDSGNTVKNLVSKISNTFG
jgi:hypothetical protein